MRTPAPAHLRCPPAARPRGPPRATPRGDPRSPCLRRTTARAPPRRPPPRRQAAASAATRGPSEVLPWPRRAAPTTQPPSHAAPRHAGRGSIYARAEQRARPGGGEERVTAARGAVDSKGRASSRMMRGHSPGKVPNRNPNPKLGRRAILHATCTELRYCRAKGHALVATTRWDCAEHVAVARIRVCTSFAADFRARPFEPHPKTEEASPTPPPGRALPFY